MHASLARIELQGSEDWPGQAYLKPSSVPERSKT